MAVKLSIRIDITVYPNGDYRNNDDRNAQIKSKLTTIFDKIKVPVDRFFAPSRETIKVVIRNEGDIDKVFSKIQEFSDQGFMPRLSMALRASLTVFVAGYDPTLTQTYDANNIRLMLRDQGWGVRNVYILQSKKAFKILLNSKAEVNRFLEMETVKIGNIQISKKQIDREVNPIIPQCWGCGKIEAGHNKENCRNKVCMKCKSPEHEFPQCTIPKEQSEITPQQKARLFCVPCNKQGDHSSLDHRACPTKRKIVQERIKESRKQREEEDMKLQKEKQTMKKAFEYISSEFPQINQMNCNITTATIITLTLLEEAVSPGCFQEKLNKACEDNNVDKVIYKPDQKTANAVFNAICTPLITPEQTEKISEKKKNHPGPSIKVKTVTHTRWVNDERKRASVTETGSEDDEMVVEGINAVKNLTKKNKIENTKSRSHIESVKQNLGLLANVATEQLENEQQNEGVSMTLQAVRNTFRQHRIIMTDSTVKEGEVSGVRNATVKEILNLITSKVCKNDNVWIQDMANGLNKLIKGRMGDCMVHYTYVSYPEEDFQMRQ